MLLCICFYLTVLVGKSAQQTSSSLFPGRDCDKPLGMEDGKIGDSFIISFVIAASIYNNNSADYGPGRARLNHTGGYRAQPNSQQTSLSINFAKATIITGIATQGYSDPVVGEWVVRFFMGYTFGDATHYFKPNHGSNFAKDFQGNNDSNTIVFNPMPVPAVVNSVVIYPKRWHTNFAIRLELYGCLHDGNECGSIPCRNNGTCVELIGGYICNCTGGFNGTNCEINIDECTSSPCAHGGNCTDLVNDFNCTCPEGYTGKKCETEIDECEYNSCQNNGTCIDLLNGFFCNCSAGFKGTFCETDIDDCFSDPCQNNGTCVDLVNEYFCNCTVGFNGTHCQEDIDECQNSSCQNNATCVDQINGYVCNCSAGFNGTFCQTDIDECASVVCAHGGSCSDVINGFVCSCTDGFGGPTCNEETGFFLAVWLGLNIRFSLPLLNETSDIFTRIGHNVTAEVDNMLKDQTGYYGSVLRKFSPSYLPEVIAEVLVRGLKNSTGQLTALISSKVNTLPGIFDPNYFEYEDRANPLCIPPNASLPLPKTMVNALRVSKFRNSAVTIDFGKECRSTLRVTFYLQLFLVDPNTGVLFFKRTTVGSTTSDSFRWNIPRQNLDYSTYYVFLKVQMFNINGTVHSDFGFLEIIYSRLVANISGKRTFSQGLRQVANLSAASSYDPDVGQGDYSGMNFTWSCKRKGETFPENQTSLPVVIPSDKIYDSLEIDKGGCYGSGVGLLVSKGLNFYVELDVDKMKGNQEYDIQLLVTKGERNTRAFHALTVKKEINLYIKCIQNCQQNNVAASARLIRETECRGMLCGQRITYKWVLRERLRANVWPQWQEVHDMDVILLTYQNSPNVVIKENKLNANTTYRLEVVGRTDEGFSSLAFQEFTTNSPPFGGQCNSDRKEGKAWETNFIFRCSDWKDDDTKWFTYIFRYDSSDGIEMVFQTISSNKKVVAVTGKLPVGDRSNSFKLEVQVLIIDSHGSAAVKRLEVMVKDPDIVTETIEKAVSEEGEMVDFLKKNDIEKAAQRATAVLSVVNHAPPRGMKVSDKIQIKGSVVDAWTGVNVTSLQEVGQISAVIASVSDKKDELSVESQEKAVDILDTMTTFMTNKVRNKSEAEREEVIQEVGASLLLGMGNMIDITSYNSFLLLSRDRARTRRDLANEEDVEKTKQITRKTLQLVDQVGSNLEDTKKLYEKPTVISTRSLSMIIDRQVPSRIGGKTLEEKGAKVSLPSTLELLPGIDGNDNSPLSSQLLSFKSNPFTWDESAKSVQSSVLDFELKDANGTHLNVTGLSKEIEMFLTLKREPGGANVSSTYFVKPSLNGSSSNMRYHSISILGKEYAVSIRVVPLKNVSLTVYVRYNKRPTISEYNFTATLPDFSSCNNGKENCSADPHAVVISSAVTGHVGLHYVGVRFQEPTEPLISPKQRERRDCSFHNGRRKRSCVGVKDPPTTVPPTKVIYPSYNVSSDVNYTMVVSMATCLFWDLSAQYWNTDGCRVGYLSTYMSLHCLCNHLSSFGGDFLVAPNPIDFDKVFRKFPDILDDGNYVVLLTVCTILALWLLALLLARRADRKDELKANENLLLQSSGGYRYDISVYTGMWRNSGTSAHVGLILSGEDGDSGVLQLSDCYSDKKLFARASINNFSIAVPESLGPLITLRLWHDNSGSNPSWLVEQIVVEDLQTEEKSYFLCNRWLAVDKENGKVEATFPLASTPELSAFRYQFYSRVTKNLGDGHLWLSVFTRPPHSPFTRAQRVSCCVCILMTAMVAGAMFYQFGEEDTGAAVKVGPLRLSVRQLVIGVQSALVVVPINLLIATIFRNIKMNYQKPASKYRPNDGERDGAEVDAKTERPPGCLPHFFVFIGWALCILSTLASATFVVFYSIEWGSEISNQWLTSALVSFVQDIAVMQPLKVILLAIFLALILRKPHEEKTAQSVKDSELDVNKNAKIEAPKGDDLVVARKHRQNIKSTLAVVVEFTVFILFVVCLMVIAYGNRSPDRYRLTESLDNLLKYEEVTTNGGFWNWSNEVLIPVLYETTWYNDQPFLSEEGYISTREAFFVGMPRLRQMRVRPESPCEVTLSNPSVETHLHIERCLPSYSSHVKDTTRYNLPGWIPVTNISKYKSIYDLERLCPKPWRYNTTGELSTIPYQGKEVTYDGGGYVADLGYNSRTALGVLDELETTGWLDEYTAAVIVEFTVFEPSSSLISHAKLLYEVPNTGKGWTTWRVDTLSVYGSTVSSLRSLYVAFQIILLILIFYSLLSEIGKMYRQNCSYFRSFWNWMDLLQLLTAMTTVAFFFLKEKYVSSFVKHIQANPFETVSMDYVVFWSDLELFVLSSVVFIVTIKFLRLIRFNPHVCQMSATLRKSFGIVLSYFVVFFVDLVAFSLTAVLLFGRTTEAYFSFVQALSSLFQQFLGGDLYYEELRNTHPIAGPTFVFFYLTSMTFILINMFLAILNDTYESVRETSGGKFSDSELGEFMKNYYAPRLRNIQGIINRKLGIFGYKHEDYDRPGKECKMRKQPEIIGSFESFYSLNFPVFAPRGNNDSSQLNLVENEERLSFESESEQETNVPTEPAQPQVSESPSPPHGTSSTSSACTDSTSVSSKTELLDLLSDLPESLVDDDETVDGVRTKLAEMGAVLRLSKRSYRKFSKTGDKFVVQREIQMTPKVAITFKAHDGKKSLSDRKDDDVHVALPILK